MADESKKYLIQIESNLSEYAKQAEQAKKQVEELKRQNEALKESGTATAQEIEKSNAALRVAQQDYKNAQKSVENATRANKAQSGSYEQLYRQWQLAQTQLKLMGNAYTVNEKGVRELSAEYIKQSKVVANAKASLDAFGKGVHDNRLNVGNYTDSIKAAMGEMQMMPGVLGQATSGLQRLNIMFKTLIANPIVLIITAIVGALTALFKALKAFDPIVDKIQQTMRGLSAVFSTLRDGIIGLISGQKSLGETFRDLGGNIRKAYNEGVAWMKLQQELDDMNWLLIESEAKLQNQVDELILQSKDRSKSEAERVALIEKALKIEEQLYNERKLVADRERLIAEEAIISGRKLTDEQISQLREVGVAYAIQLKDTKDVTDEEVSNLANAVAKQERVLNQSIKIREMAINRQNVLLDKAEAAEAKRQEQREKDAEKAKADMEKAKADLAKELDDYKKYLDDRRQADLDAAQKKRDDQIAKQEWEREQRLINEENLLAIQEQTSADSFAIERQRLELERQEEIRQANQTGADINLINQKYALAQTELIRQQNLQKASLFQSFADSVAQIFGENTAIGRIAAVASATINTYKAATEALSAYPPPFSYIAMATTIATGLAQVKRILSVKSGLPGDSGGGSAPTAITASIPAQRIFAQQVGASYLTQPQLTQSQLNAVPSSSPALTADDIATAVAKIPPPVVTVEDINARTNQSRKVEVRGTI